MGDFARSAGVTTYMLSEAEAVERGRATGKKWRGGVFSPTDNTADLSRAAPATGAVTGKQCMPCSLKYDSFDAGVVG